MKKTKKNTRSRQYLAETMIDADYVDDLRLLPYTLVLAESLQHNPQ